MTATTYVYDDRLLVTIACVIFIVGFILGILAGAMIDLIKEVFQDEDSIPVRQDHIRRAMNMVTTNEIENRTPQSPTLAQRARYPENHHNDH